MFSDGCDPQVESHCFSVNPLPSISVPKALHSICQTHGLCAKVYKGLWERHYTYLGTEGLAGAVMCLPQGQDEDT